MSRNRKGLAVLREEATEAVWETEWCVCKLEGLLKLSSVGKRLTSPLVQWKANKVLSREMGCSSYFKEVALCFERRKKRK